MRKFTTESPNYHAGHVLNLENTGMCAKTGVQKQFNIVLTDDNPLLRKELKNFISSDPELNITGEAGNGLELLGYLYKLNNMQQNLPDLVILDISMPYLGGIETARQIKLVYPTVKILFLSIYDNREYLEYAVAGGAEGYLLKNEMDSEIFAAIKTVRSGYFYLSPGFKAKNTD
jgi:DNA-binding NarL/FixJ family response regulator